MTKPKDGGPAFSEMHLIQQPHGGTTYYTVPGMTLRQWYAGQAASGWLASFNEGESSRPEDIATFAFEVADALIAEGEKDD